MATATRKTAVASKPVADAAAPEYDFDNWTEDAEEAALAELAQSFKYIIVEGSFIGRFSDGEIIRLPLEFEADAISGLDETLSGVEQLRQMLSDLGDEETAAVVVRKPFTQMTACAALYFEKIEEVTKRTLARFERASLGE